MTESQNSQHFIPVPPNRSGKVSYFRCPDYLVNLPDLAVKMHTWTTVSYSGETRTNLFCSVHGFENNLAMNSRNDEMFVDLHFNECCGMIIFRYGEHLFKMKVDALFIFSFI